MINHLISSGTSKPFYTYNGATISGTKVEIGISFSSEADFEKILAMSFEQGKWGAIGSLLGAGSFIPSFFIPID